MEGMCCVHDSCSRIDGSSQEMLSKCVLVHAKQQYVLRLGWFNGGLERNAGKACGKASDVLLLRCFATGAAANPLKNQA